MSKPKPPPDVAPEPAPPSLYPVFDRLRSEREQEAKARAPVIPSVDAINDSGMSTPRRR